MNNLSAQTILLGAGVVFIFLAIVGRVILPKIGIGPEFRKWTRIGLAIVGVIFLAGGVFYPLFQIRVVESSPTPTPSLTITYPSDNAEVGIEETVEGTSRNVPKEQAIWIVIHPHGVDRYYPQDYAAQIKANGDWSSSAFIGIEKDAGKKFDIIAVLTDNEAQDAFRHYLEECKTKKSWPGLERLPASAVVHDRNEVTRRVVTAFQQVYVPDAFHSSGWMGDWGDIVLDDASTHAPHSKPTCVRIAYSAARSQGKGWAGIYWQYPDKNWGDKQEARDLTGAKRLTFWARGGKGKERAEFKVGGITGKYPDSIQPPVSTGVTVLSDSWTQYTIDLAGYDLSHVIGGFCWVTNRNQNPNGCTVYLDDIRFE